MGVRLRFLALFLATWVTGLVGLAFFPGIEEALARQTAIHLGFVMPLFGMSPAREGTMLNVREISFDVKPICSAAPAMLALFAAMLAYPATPLRRIAGMALGGATLWCYNLLRLVLLAELMLRRSPWFGFFHLYLWQTVTVVVVGGIFLAWIRDVERRRAGDGLP